MGNQITACSDPVTCVRHFDHRVSHFIETILKSPQSPLGVLQDFLYRVEFQQRRSPHIHMLAWIQEALIYGENDDAEVIEYIDRVASCSVDVPEDIQRLWTFKSTNILEHVVKQVNPFVVLEYRFHLCERQQLFSPMLEKIVLFTKIITTLCKSISIRSYRMNV